MRLVTHSCLVNLRAEVGSGGARSGKVSRENWLNEGPEDNLGAAAQTRLERIHVEIDREHIYPV